MDSVEQVIALLTADAEIKEAAQLRLDKNY